MALDSQIDDLLSGEPANEEEGETPLSSSDPLDGEEELQQALIKLYGKCKADDRYPRLVEVKDVKKAEFYWSGRQYVWWSDQDQRYNLPTQQMSGYGDIDVDEMPRFEFVTNIYQARGLMVIGAVAGAPPRVRFFPSDADEENDLETAEARTKLAKQIQRWNPPQKSLQEESYHAWTGGFIAYWTRYVEDGERYGVDSVSMLSQSEENVDSTILCPQCGWSAPAAEAEPPVPCPQCGAPLTEENISEESPISVPEESGEEQVAKGRQVISVYGALNCARPQHVNHQSGYHYFGIEEEIHYSILRDGFPDKEDDIKPGLNQGNSDVFERNARLSVAENTKLVTQSGANQANLCTFVRAWFRKSAFRMLDDKAMRKKAIEKFPNGCRIEFTGSVYLKSEAKSMDAEIVTCHAVPGRGQHRPAIGTSMLSVQDRVNTFSNIEAETYEYGIPITYRASDTFAAEADDEQRAAPGLEVEVALRAGENIASRIMQLRADSVSPDMYQHANELIGPVSDQLTGTYPALTGAGGDQGAPDTLGQQAMQRDQAMGRMGIFYVNLKQAHADVLTLACRDYEAHASGVVKLPVLAASGDFESESVDISALEGEAEAYPEGDENFPELWNQQRATMQQVMDSPYGQELIKEPGNAELFAKLTGIPDLKIPGLASWQKQLKEIGQLTKIPEGVDMLSGLAPNVEVDSDDFHDIESSCCKWWLNSDKGQKVKRENPIGFIAVKEHKAQHDAAIPKPEPAVKPLSPTVTTAFKDMPPEAQAQWLEKEFGIKVDPQAFIQQIAFERAKKGVDIQKPATGKEAAPGKPATVEPANAAVSGAR